MTTREEAFQSLINDAVKGRVSKMCAEGGIITLGELIAKLEKHDRKNPVKFEDGTVPGHFMSYRGYYDHLAIDHGGEMTVGELLDRANEANGTVYEGYKGGEYKMSRMTPVWVAEYGESGGIGIIDVGLGKESVILVTKEIDN